MRRVIVWLAGILVVVGVIAPMLLATVPGDRGRDEINLLTIHELPLATGGVLTQPVPLQRPAPYGIELPYQWRGDHPAQLDVSVKTPDGVVINATEVLDNSRLPLLAEPIGDGSYWQRHRAAFHLIRLPSSAVGTMILRLTRVDREPGTLVLFASDRLPPPTVQIAGTQLDSRPTLVEDPTEYLDLRTEYGTPGPAIAKAPTYVSRLQTLAPPWLPFPLPELLLALMVAAGIYLCSVTAFAKELAPKGG
ncbi:MAG: hypothetical protein E6J20_02085 [Chloroflexi bacterium]|nr:MAG: hypothetical protein E6J20_02085 [Chloroflexota bacterium]